MIKNILNRFKKHPEVNSEDKFLKTSFSQCGEDLIVKYIFQLRSVTNPSYMDIGANHPYFLNNTAAFYKSGSRGINIEANPYLIEAFHKEREHDINLNVGISDQESEMDFYIMEDNTLSTFSEDEMTAMQKAGKALKETKKVNLITFQTAIKKYFNNKCPDFLTIDVEGLDFAILRTIDFSIYSPKVICVEAAEYSPIGAGARRNDLIDFLTEKGYYEYANTNLNAIMVKRDFWFI